MHFFPKKCKINKKSQKYLSYESLHHKKGTPQGSFSSATRTREFRGIRKFQRNNRQSVAAENPRLRVRICSKKEPRKVPLVVLPGLEPGFTAWEAVVLGH